ncbi:MAG: TadE/TadG family type IV pilus assembly protein [Acidimicrobiales bacterium]
MRPCRRGRGRPPQPDRGQATVELVLVLPVVATVLLAVVQVGLVVRDQVLVVHAAREAARAAAVDPSGGAAREAAAAATGLDPGRLGVTVGPQRAPGQRLAVTVTYTAPTRVPVVGALVGDLRLQAEVTTRVE